MTLSIEKLSQIEAAASKATPVAWLCGRTVDAFAAAGYETCKPSDYGAFPVYATLCDPATVAALVRIARAAVEYYDGTNVAYGTQWRSLGDALRAAGLIE